MIKTTWMVSSGGFLLESTIELPCPWMVGQETKLAKRKKASTWGILGYHAPRVSCQVPLGGQSTTRSSWRLWVGFILGVGASPSPLPKSTVHSVVERLNSSSQQPVRSVYRTNVQPGPRQLALKRIPAALKPKRQGGLVWLIPIPTRVKGYPSMNDWPTPLTTWFPSLTGARPQDLSVKDKRKGQGLKQKHTAHDPNVNPLCHYTSRKWTFF